MSGDFDLLLRDRIASARQQGAHDRANGVAFSACPFARVSLVNAWEAGWNEEDQRVAEAIDLMFVLRKSLKKQKARSENSKSGAERMSDDAKPYATQAEIDELVGDIFEPGFESCPVQNTYGELEEKFARLVATARAGLEEQRDERELLRRVGVLISVAIVAKPGYEPYVAERDAILGEIERMGIVTLRTIPTSSGRSPSDGVKE